MTKKNETKKKKPTKGLNPKQRNEVDEIVGKAVNGITGDMSEYLNYIHDRLDQISEHLELPLLSYEEELARRYNFDLRKTKKPNTT